MNRIKLALYLTLVLLAAAWLLADSLVPQPLEYATFRNAFMQFSGVVAIGVMSVAMLLAVRPTWLEPFMGGLDKMYRLHKWLGITALVVSVLHWWMGQGTKWMVDWGWLTWPERAPDPDPSGLGAVEFWLDSQREWAEQAGEWVFYAAAVLLVLALVRRFPYHLFRQTHKWLSLGYLVLVYHSVALVKFEYWHQPVGWLLVAMMAAGSVAAVLSLSGRIGARLKVGGTIESLHYYPGLKVLESHIALGPGWTGHAAGQFAFVTSDTREGPHPYTIASAWKPDERRITFITKALGDHTGRLHERLKAGMPVTVEGPYGCFNFNDGRLRQIWIGAGIGITPFVARMKHLAAHREGVEIDLFHCTADYEPAAIDKLKADARAAGVRLHLLVDQQDGRLDGRRLRSAVPDWAGASVWFCGPPGFGQALRQDLLAHGLPAHRFHQELFQMR